MAGCLRENTNSPSCRAYVMFSHELICFSLPLARPFLNHLNYCNGTSNMVTNTQTSHHHDVDLQSCDCPHFFKHLHSFLAPPTTCQKLLHFSQKLKCRLDLSHQVALAVSSSNSKSLTSKASLLLGKRWFGMDRSINGG